MDKLINGYGSCVYANNMSEKVIFYLPLYVKDNLMESPNTKELGKHKETLN